MELNSDETICAYRVSWGDIEDATATVAFGIAFFGPFSSSLSHSEKRGLGRIAVPTSIRLQSEDAMDRIVCLSLSPLLCDADTADFASSAILIYTIRALY
jgi:hypothetical protein